LTCCQRGISSHAPRRVIDAQRVRLLVAVWLRLRALNGLLGRDLRDGLFELAVGLLSRLRLERTGRT